MKHPLDAWSDQLRLRSRNAHKATKTNKDYHALSHGEKIRRTLAFNPFDKEQATALALEHLKVARDFLRTPILRDSPHHPDGQLVYRKNATTEQIDLAIKLVRGESI